MSASPRGWAFLGARPSPRPLIPARPSSRKGCGRPAFIITVHPSRLGHLESTRGEARAEALSRRSWSSVRSSGRSRTPDRPGQACKTCGRPFDRLRTNFRRFCGWSGSSFLACLPTRTSHKTIRNLRRIRLSYRPRPISRILRIVSGNFRGVREEPFQPGSDRRDVLAPLPGKPVPISQNVRAEAPQNLRKPLELVPGELLHLLQVVVSLVCDRPPHPVMTFHWSRSSPGQKPLRKWLVPAAAAERLVTAGPRGKDARRMKGGG